MVFIATGYQLRRGYKIAAVKEDKPHDIDHIIFVVHGIGQKGDTGKIIRNTTLYVENIINDYNIVYAIDTI